MKKKNAVVWIHGDNLSATNPIFQVYEDTPALFVWDGSLIDRWHVSLKRISFMYDSLLNLPVDIRRGDVVNELVTFAESHGAIRIATVPSPTRRFKQVCKELEKRGYLLDILQPTAFINYDKSFDLRCLSDYTASVQPALAYH